MTSAFETMAVSMWDVLGSVLVAKQKSFELDAGLEDGCAMEVSVFFFPEYNPRVLWPDAVLFLKAEAAELIDARRTDRSRISGSAEYVDHAFHRKLVKLLGKCGIKVQSSRVEKLIKEPPAPPLVAVRARYLLDRVLEQFPLWWYWYKESFMRGHDLYARAILSPDCITRHKVSFSPAKIEGRIEPSDFSLPVSEFAVDCADPDFRKQFAASLADPHLQQIDLSGLP